MFRKSQKQAEKQMIDIINSRNNINKCGECGSDFPTWASLNLGILLCGRCANCHRKVLSRNGPDGKPISIVKSLTLEAWSDSQLEHMRRIGNKRAKQRWNPKKVPFPHDDDVDFLIEEYLRDKYIEGKFRDDTIDASEYGGSDYLQPDHGRSRLSSVKDIPRLSHRKLTTFEQTQFRQQAQKLRGFGYSDQDAILESLILANGDTSFALDILDNDARVNPQLEELPPSLPKRPTQSAQSTASQTTAPTSAGSDWWNQGQAAGQSTGQSVQATGQYQQTGQFQQTGQVQQTGQFPQATGAASQFPQATGAAFGQPQIYQYTDPVTGQVSYVDANGQQYLDPSNPQHQQLLMQQTNPQYLQQQATKLNILSLYNQPQSQTQQNTAHPVQQQNTVQQNAVPQSVPLQNAQTPIQSTITGQFTGFGYPQTYGQNGQMTGQQFQAYGQYTQQPFR